MTKKNRSSEVRKPGSTEKASALPRFRTSALFFCFAALLLCPLSYAQPPAAPAMPQDIPVESVKSVMKIEVNDGLLSVELSDAEFGNVIKEIAEKAKFKAEISGDVAVKKISTTFKDIEVERGVRRLLTIIKEKDFTISYNTAGLIDKLEIYGGGINKPVNTQPQTQKPPIRQNPFQRVTPPSPLPPPTTLPQ